ncbi:MAG: SdpI family protein [Anaerolineaceae bacterium]
MNTRNTVLVTLILAGLAFLAGAALYPQMGAQMATHWGPAGNADGYGSRFEGLFLLPIIAMGATLLMLGIPLIDPLKSNIEYFHREYNLFVVFMSAFFYYLYVLTILFNFGLTFSMTTFLIPAFALLLYFSGRLLKRARRNYFIGIRTPWTLSSDVVWDRTHRFGGTAFQVAGAFSLVGILFPSVAFLFLMVPLLTVAFLVILYSYLVFRQEEKKAAS